MMLHRPLARPRGARVLLVVLLVVLAHAAAAGSALAQSASPAATATTVSAPETFFGFRMGTDGRLAAWQEKLGEKGYQDVTVTAGGTATVEFVLTR